MSRRPWGRDADHVSGPLLGRQSGLSRPVGGRLPRTSLVVALVLACMSLMLLDRTGTPIADPLRSAAGEAFGPAESGTAAAVRPVAALPDYFGSQHAKDDQIATLTAENQQLLAREHTAGYNAKRLAELDGLTSTAEDLGYALVPARVIGIGPAQSFSSTVTIDAGSSSGLSPDMTVVNGDGLVGRILRVTGDTATVLLIVDSDSTVGARLGDSLEMGFLHGRGVIGSTGRLDLDLVDQTAVPARHENVVTWGSQGAGPYVSGVPVGQVTSVYRSLRDSAQRAVIEPFVDFSALDLVGVIVPSGTHGDRSVIEADGSIR